MLYAILLYLQCVAQPDFLSERAFRRAITASLHREPALRAAGTMLLSPLLWMPLVIK